MNQTEIKALLHWRSVIVENKRKHLENRDTKAHKATLAQLKSVDAKLGVHSPIYGK